MTTLTLLRQGSPLADPVNQRRVLACARHQPFEQALAVGGRSLVMHPLAPYRAGDDLHRAPGIVAPCADPEI